MALRVKGTVKSAVASPVTTAPAEARCVAFALTVALPGTSCQSFGDGCGSIALLLPSRQPLGPIRIFSKWGTPKIPWCFQGLKPMFFPIRMLVDWDNGSCIHQLSSGQKECKVHQMIPKVSENYFLDLLQCQTYTMW